MTQGNKVKQWTGKDAIIQANSEFTNRCTSDQILNDRAVQKYAENLTF